MLPEEDGVSSTPQACSIAVDGPKQLFSSLSYLPYSRTANLNHGMIIVNTC